MKPLQPLNDSILPSSNKMVVWIGRYFVVTLGLAVAFMVGLYFFQSNETEFGEHVAKVDWLPPDATDVSYYRSDSWTAYEFAISETGFLQWAKKNRWPVAVIGEKQPTIPTYLFMAHKVSSTTRPVMEPSNEVEQIAELERYRSETHVFGSGYYYRFEQDNGGGLSVGYDANEGRAYCQHSPR